jgi:S-adenosylmethionine:diacylglycerol 3-amino-3-carboxypropyl transferase
MATGVKGVVFGHMHEDHAAELSLVERLPLRQAVVIASGGDLAFALAGKKVEVLAIDSNPAQIELVKLKIQFKGDLTALCFCGRVDRVLRFGGPILGWLMDVPRLQPGPCRRFLINFSESLLRQFVSCVHSAEAGVKLDPSAIGLIRQRLEQAMKNPEAAKNPLLQVLLGRRFGREIPAVWSDAGIRNWRSETQRIQFLTGDFTAVLSELPAASLGLISVSNLPDAMSQDAWESLVENAARALATSGYLVVRSMLREGVQSASDRCFVSEAIIHQDTSPLCPVIWIGRKKYIPVLSISSHASPHPADVVAPA